MEVSWQHLLPDPCTLDSSLSLFVELEFIGLEYIETVHINKPFCKYAGVAKLANLPQTVVFGAGDFSATINKMH